MPTAPDPATLPAAAGPVSRALSTAALPRYTAHRSGYVRAGYDVHGEKVAVGTRQERRGNLAGGRPRYVTAERYAPNGYVLVRWHLSRGQGELPARDRARLVAQGLQRVMDVLVGRGYTVEEQCDTTSCWLRVSRSDEQGRTITPGGTP